MLQLASINLQTYLAYILFSTSGPLFQEKETIPHPSTLRTVKCPSIPISCAKSRHRAEQGRAPLQDGQQQEQSELISYHCIQSLLESP